MSEETLTENGGNGAASELQEENCTTGAAGDNVAGEPLWRHRNLFQWIQGGRSILVRW